MPPIISIVGQSGSGKTTLIERLIPELKRRGYRIGIIKHALHGFSMDKKGKDSQRHKAAGADGVMVASPGAIAMVKDVAAYDLDELGNYFSDMDLIITEGFKQGPKLKIEVFRAAVHQAPLCLTDAQLVALVTDTEINGRMPQFNFSQIVELADFIEKVIL